MCVWLIWFVFLWADSCAKKKERLSSCNSMEVEPTTPREAKSVASDTSRVATLRKTRIRPSTENTQNFQLFCMGLVTNGPQPCRRSFAANARFEKHVVGIIHGFLSDFTRTLVARAFQTQRFQPNDFQGAVARLVCDGFDLIDSPINFIKPPRKRNGLTTLLVHLAAAVTTVRPDAKVVSVCGTEDDRVRWGALDLEMPFDTSEQEEAGWRRWAFRVGVLKTQNFLQLGQANLVFVDYAASHFFTPDERKLMLRSLAPDTAFFFFEYPPDDSDAWLMLPAEDAQTPYTAVKKLVD